MFLKIDFIVYLIMISEISQVNIIYIVIRQCILLYLLNSYRVIINNASKINLISHKEMKISI